MVSISELWSLKITASPSGKFILLDKKSTLEYQLWTQRVIRHKKTATVLQIPIFYS